MYRWSPWEKGEFQFSGCKLTQTMTFSIHVSQEDFCNSLTPGIQNGGARADSDPLTAQETSQARALLMKGQWRALQSAPQFCARIGLASSAVSKPTVVLLKGANNIVKDMQKTAKEDRHCFPDRRGRSTSSTRVATSFFPFQPAASQPTQGTQRGGPRPLRPHGRTAATRRDHHLHHGGSESCPSPTAPNHKPSARPRPDRCSPKAERQGPRHRGGGPPATHGRQMFGANLRNPDPPSLPAPPVCPFNPCWNGSSSACPHSSNRTNTRPHHPLH